MADELKSPKVTSGKELEFSDYWSNLPENKRESSDPGATGDQVEDYIKRTTVTDVQYLDGKLYVTKNGTTDEGTPITLEKITYSYSLSIADIKINGITTTSPNFQYVDGTVVELGLVIYGTASSPSRTSYLPGPFNIKIELVDSSIAPITTKIESSYDTTTKTAKPVYVDITKLLQSASVDNKIKVTLIGVKDELDQPYVATSNFNIKSRIINIQYLGDYVLGTFNSTNNPTVTFNVNGELSEDRYQLVGYVKQGASSVSTIENSSNTSYTLEYPGLTTLYVKAVNTSDTSIETEYIQVNVINAKNFDGTAAVVNQVSSIVNNCDLSQLYRIDAYSYKEEDINIQTYIDEGIERENMVENFVISEENYENHTFKHSYVKYIEVHSSNTVQYLSIKINDDYVDFYEFFNGNLYSQKFKPIQVSKINLNFTYYDSIPPVLRFDQVNTHQNNVFITKEYGETNLNELAVDEGWIEDTLTGRSIFRIRSREENLFKNDISLDLSSSAFSLEFFVRTFNIGDEDSPILTIGDLQLRPTQLCWNTTGNTFNQRNSLFCKDKDTHIIVTYQSDYYVSPADPNYFNYIGELQEDYDTNVKKSTFNLVRIYINGVIDREFTITGDEFSNAKLQICPKSCDVDFYTLRIYNNVCLNYQEIQKNYISCFTKLKDKQNFYSKNDIIVSQNYSTTVSGNQYTGLFDRISFAKAYQKYNCLVYVLPKGKTPPTKGWGDRDVSKNTKISDGTLFILYKDTKTEDSETEGVVKYPLRQYSGRLNHLEFKPQGSSAMLYLIYNITSGLNKLKVDGNKIKSEFVSLNQLDFDTNRFKSNASPDLTGYYKMPIINKSTVSSDSLEITKLVGKVNFASSMQSHKIGATKLYHNAYPGSLYSGGRKAVLEEPFLYFSYTSQQTDVSNVELAELLENDNDVRFMGFQTWGSAKGDKATSGYDENVTPEYMMFEGAENEAFGCNFRVPWAYFQRKTIDTGGVRLNSVPTVTGKVAAETNLLIDGESIHEITISDKSAAWDIDFGQNDDGDGILDSVKTTINKFREFHDFCYKYNTLLTWLPNSITNSNDIDSYMNTNGGRENKVVVTSNKFTDTSSTTSRQAQQYEIFRWDDITSKWVPGGLYYNTASQRWDPLTIENLGLGLTSVQYGNQAMVVNAIETYFKNNISNYVDVDDVAYHQAFIRFVSGTDNRAKNTYFQIIGPKYALQKTTEIQENKTYYRLDTESHQYKKLFIYKDGGTYKVKKSEAEEENYTGDIYSYLPNGEGDYKIRLWADDLDTIFATNNNGLLTKPYNLLEPPFNSDTKELWGDSGQNRFFYMFDTVYEENIRGKLNTIMTNCGMSGVDDVDSKNSNFYDYFFRVQEEFPEVAFNHTSKLWYENAKQILLWKSLRKNDWSQYDNRDEDPLSQSHGPCLQGEKAFLSKRVALLNSYAQVDINQTAIDLSLITSDGSSNKKAHAIIEFTTCQDLYPMKYPGTDDTDRYLYSDPDKKYITLKHLVSEGNLEVDQYNVSKYINGKIVEFNKTANAVGLVKASYFRTLKLIGSQNEKINFTLPNLLELYIDNDLINKYDALKSDVIEPLKISQFNPTLEVLQRLILRNIKFTTPKKLLDLSNYTKLKYLDLTGSDVEELILPSNNCLEIIKLPNSIKNLTIRKNPKLNSIQFESLNNIENLNIDQKYLGKDVNISSILDTIISNPNLTSVTIKNANVNVKESTILKLAELANNNSIEHSTVLSGQFNIVPSLEQVSYSPTDPTTPVDLVPISFTTKRILVDAFKSNIDTGEDGLLIKYQPVDLTIGSLRGSSEISVYFPENYDQNLQGDYTIKNPFAIQVDGNKVKITNKKLDIHYSINNTEYVELIDEYSGDIKLKKEGNSGMTSPEVTLTLQYIPEGKPLSSTEVSSAKPVTIKVNPYWDPPKIGQLAYSDGTFSYTNDSTKSIVGLVYKVDKNSATTGVARILGKELLPEMSIGLSLKERAEVNNQLCKDIYTLIDMYSYEANPDVSNNPNFDALTSITSETNLNKSEYTFTGKVDTKKYVEYVNSKLSQLLSGIGVTFKYSENDETPSNPLIKAGLPKGFAANDNGYYIWDLKTAINIVDTYLQNKHSLVSGTSGSLTLFPYFYQIYLYEPNVSGVLHEQYRKNNWYAASLGEMTYLIYDRGIATGKTTWNSYEINTTEINKNVTTSAFAIAANNKNYFWADLFGNGLSTFVTTISSSSQENYSYTPSNVSGSYQISATNMPAWRVTNGYINNSGNFTDTYRARASAHATYPLVDFEYSKYGHS